MAHDFTGKAGTIYVQKSKDADENPYEVWFEDFCILGTGSTEFDALQDAAQNTANISLLIATALATVSAQAASGD